MEWIDLLQWPAMAVSLLAAWMVASRQQRRREIGFRVFLPSNRRWIAWGLHDGAHALVALQACLGLANLRGVRRNG